MFGYVKPKISELRVKEYELYKSIYCGLCRCMGERVCRASEMTLSYDIVFLALIRIALEDDAASVSRRRCAVHPIKKRSVLDSCDSLVYSARAGALLAYYNILDNVNDRRGAGRAGTAMLMPYAKRMRRRAGLPELDSAIKTGLCELSELEKSRCGSLDMTSEAFGKLLGSVFSFGIEDNTNSRIAYEAGLHTGRWIYMIDAIDDYAADCRSGEYNPIICGSTARSGTDDLSGCLTDNETESLRCALMLELERLSLALELIDFKDDGIKNIIYNIVYTGMAEKSDAVIKKAGHAAADGEKEERREEYTAPDERIKI